MFDDLGVLYRGVLMGLMIAAPVGPVGLMCIRRTIRKGLLIGFISGFGAAFADTFFGAIAAFGVAAIVDWIKLYTHSIHIVGGVLLFVGAWHTWHDKPRQFQQENGNSDANNAPQPQLGAAIRAGVSSFMITLTNPATIFAMLAVVAAFGGVENNLQAVLLVIGIFTGSSLWWLMLSGGTSLVRMHITENSVTWINHFMAIALSVAAIWALTTGVLGNLGLPPLFPSV